MIQTGFARNLTDRILYSIYPYNCMKVHEFARSHSIFLLSNIHHHPFFIVLYQIIFNFFQFLCFRSLFNIFLILIFFRFFQFLSLFLLSFFYILCLLSLFRFYKVSFCTVFFLSIFYIY